MWIGASCLGSAIFVLSATALAGNLERAWLLAAAVALTGFLSLSVRARSPWLRRPALTVLLALLVAGAIVALLIALIAVILAAAALLKLLLALVAQGLGFAWSSGSGDSDSDSDSGDSSTDNESQSDDRNSGQGIRAALSRLPGWQFGAGGTASSDPKSCPGCGRAAGTGPGGLCRSCSW